MSAAADRRELPVLPRSGADFRREVLDRWELDGPELVLLDVACETLDRLRNAQEVIAAEGPTFVDRLGNPRLRPEAVIERDCRLAFARLYKQLGLHEEPKPEKPPAEPLALAPRRKVRR